MSNGNIFERPEAHPPASLEEKLLDLAIQEIRSCAEALALSEDEVEELEEHARFEAHIRAREITRFQTAKQRLLEILKQQRRELETYRARSVTSTNTELLGAIDREIALLTKRIQELASAASGDKPLS